MKAMSAADAARNFDAALAYAERGGAVTITRGGKPVAVLRPAPEAAGRAVKDALQPYIGALDDTFEDDVMGTSTPLTWGDR